MKPKHRNLLSALVCVAYVIPVSVYAQASEPAQTQDVLPDAAATSQGIQEIVVTAERRVNDVQNVATAVSVRSGSELAAQGKYLTRQVLDDIPGVSVVENGSRNTGSADNQGTNITIRGITPGESAGAGFSQISATPSTAVYVDGVYEGMGSGYDLDRVEVLRGPQGTLYGRSATAGVVAFHTRNPTLSDFNANGSFEYGSYDLQHYTGAVNVPVGSTLAVRLAGDYRDQGTGYFGEADRGKRKRLNGRAKVLWEPTDGLSVLLGYAYEKDRAFSGGNNTTSDGNFNYTTITSPIYPGRKTQNQYWAEVNWDLGPVTVTYEGAYRTWKQNDKNLLDGNFLFTNTSLQQAIITPVNHFHTEELRFASNGTGPLSWQGGLFYYKNKLRTSLRNFLVDGTGNEVALQSATSDRKDTQNIGAFAEATYAVNPALRITLGARYDDTKVTVSEFSYENQYSLCGTAVAFVLAPLLAANNAVCTGPGQASVPSIPGTSIENQVKKYPNFNYKARVEYDLAPRNMMYASISTGFRPGDIGISQGVTNAYRAEKLTSYEIGSKNRFLDNTLQVNLAAYYYVYDGFQTTFRPDTPNPADFTTNGNQVRIGVPARNLGGELEVLYQPTDNDRIMLNYNYVRSRWVDRPAIFAAGQPGTVRPVTPHTVTAAYQHVFNVSGGGQIAARIDGKYESAHLTQNLQADLLKPDTEPQFYRGNFARVGDRATGNAQITFTTEDKRYSLTAYVRNFTNAKNPSYEVLGNVNAINVNYLDPRIFGIVAGARF